MINNNFDVISWVKDGGWMLPKTLKNLHEVPPREFVQRKLAIERLMLSPLTETFVAFKMRNPLIPVVHPNQIVLVC